MVRHEELAAVGVDALEMSKDGEKVGLDVLAGGDDGNFLGGYREALEKVGGERLADLVLFTERVLNRAEKVI